VGRQQWNKVFSLVGKVKNTGLIEVPMGIPLREIVFDIGGGIPEGRSFKAVQTGGPSGGCLPESSLDMPVDFDSLTEAGSMMGSGGMIVMDDQTCMVDVARYFIAFLTEESCGKCVPCREGLRSSLDALQQNHPGDGKARRHRSPARDRRGDAGLLPVRAGTSAANPVLSTIQYFKDEYEAHINKGVCPAGVCTALIEYQIDPRSATAAMPASTGVPRTRSSATSSRCTSSTRRSAFKCGACVEACKRNGILKVPRSHAA